MRTALLGVVAVVLFVALALLADPTLTGRSISINDPLVLEVDEVVRSGEDVRVELPGPVRVRSVSVYGSGVLTDDDLVVRVGGRSYPLVSVGDDGLTGFVVGAMDPGEGVVLDPESVDLDRVVDGFSDDDAPGASAEDRAPVDEGESDVGEGDGADGSIDGSVDLVDGGSVDEPGEAVPDAPGGSVPADREAVPEPEVRERTLLRYGDGPYDVDDDGRVGPLDAVDFVVDSDASCVVWSVVSESASVFCRGSDDCCRDFGFVGSSGEPANELVLTRDFAGGVAGSVLAREPDRSFSEPLEFSFSGSAERFVELSGDCGSACALDVVASDLVFSLGSGRFTVDRVEVEFESLGRSLIAEERRSYEVSGRSARVQAGLSDRLSRGERVRMIVRNESGFFVEALRKAQFDSLVRDGRVVEAVVDQPVSVFTTDALMITNIGSAQSTYGLTGSGVTVCVVDTGVDAGLLADTGVSYEAWNVLTGTDDTQDGHGHGTQVAYPLISAAPDASFVFVKALDDSGSGYESDVLKALDECVSRGADVISLSIGSGLYDGLCDANIVASRVNELVSNGTIVVAAAGNEGGPLLKSPACASNATAVIASDDADVLWSGSSYLEGHAVLSAPGVSIVTVDEFGIPVTASGTSMATSFVSGAVALLLENASYEPLDLRARLVSSGDVFEESGFSYARLNVENALLGFVTNDLLSGASAGNGTNGSFGVLADPVVSNVDLVFSDAAFQVTYSASDGDSDPLFNTTDWRVNGTSIAVLNAPFNVNVSTTTSGAVTDLSTYGNNGTLGNGTSTAAPGWSSDCQVGGCYSFDGNDYIEVDYSSSLVITDSFTISAWVYPTSVSGWNAIAAMHYSYTLEISDGGEVYFGFHNGSGWTDLYDNTSLQTDTWQHVTGVFDNDDDSLTIYVDGQKSRWRTSGVTSAPQDGSHYVTIGSYRDSQSFFDGRIDEVLIFRKALSPSQVKAIYDAQLEGKSVDLMNENVFGSSDDISVRVYSSDEAVYSYADSPTLTPISSCQTINAPGSYYLNQNVSATGTCFTIAANDVVLYCGGYEIEYSTSSNGYGVLINGYDRVGVRNCAIRTGSTSAIGDRAVYVVAANNFTIDRTNITLTADSGTGTQPSAILIGTASNGTVISNVRVDSEAEELGDQMFLVHITGSSADTLIENITITSTATTTPQGIQFLSGGATVRNANVTMEKGTALRFFYSSAQPLILIENSIFVNNDSVNDATIEIEGAGNLTFVNVTAISYELYPLSVFGGSGNKERYFYNSTLTNAFSGTTTIRANTNAGTTDVLHLINTTWTNDTSMGSTSTEDYFLNAYYVDIYVNDTAGDPVAGATITYTDGGSFSRNPSASGSVTTGADGWARDVIIYDFEVVYDDSLNSYNNYTFNASKSGSESVASYAITDNTELSFTIGNPVSSCQTIWSSGVYTLTQNVTATGTCMTLNADNILFNCAGHEVEYSTSSNGWGIHINEKDNVEIRNCAVTTGSTSSIGYHAIFVQEANNATIDRTNVTLTADTGASNSPSGIRVATSSNGTVVSNVRIDSSADEAGLDLHILHISTSSADTLIENVTITSTTTTKPVGIQFWSGTGNATLRNVNVTMEGGKALRFYFGTETQILVENSVFVNNDSGDYAALSMDGSGNITFVNVTGLSYEKEPFVISSSSDGAETYFYNSTLTNAFDNTRTVLTNSPASTVDIVHFINTTWTNETYMNTGATDDYFLNAHYVDIYVNDSDGNPVSGATVTYADGGSFSRNPSASGSVITGADGWARDVIIYDFEVVYSNSLNSYNNYTFSVSASGFDDLSGLSRNIVDNAELVFTLGEDVFQVVNTTLTATGGGFSVEYDVIGAASPVNTTDWRSDNVSLAVLNMPFNVNVSTTTTGAVTDLSSYSNSGTRGNGVEANSPTWNATCIVGGCYDFDGSQHIRIPYSSEFDIVNSITVEAWIYPTASGQASVSNIIAKPRPSSGGQVYSLRWASTNIPSFRFGYGAANDVRTLSATSAIPLNEWTHLVGTYDGSSMRLYVNGALNASASYSDTMTTTTTDVSIGTDIYNSDGRFFEGLIDEPKIYDRVLSAEQVLANYNAGAAGEAINTWEGADATSGEELSVRVYASNEAEYVYQDSNGYEILSACGTISSPGIYALSGDVSATGTCFTISSSDVEFSCSGNTITYATSTTGNGINVNANLNNITIRDCDIDIGASRASSIGLRFNGGSSTWITNVTIERVDSTTLSSSQSIGIYYVDNVSVIDSNASSASATALDFYYWNNVYIEGGTYTSSASNAIYLIGDGAPENATIRNVNATASASGYFPFQVRGRNITLSGLNGTHLMGSSGVNPGIRLWSEEGDALITDSYFEGYNYATYFSGGNITIANSSVHARSGQMVRMYMGAQDNAYFMNVTTNTEVVSWFSGEYVHYGHYANVSVNDTAGNPVAGATIGYTDGASNPENPTPSGTATTNSDGWVLIPLYEWSEDSSAVENSHNDYTINASKAGYGWTPSETVTMNENKQISFTLLGPEIGYCLTIDESGSYALANNVSSAGTCITIASSDVSLDCMGYTINYSQSTRGNGVLVNQNLDNISVRNCVVTQGSSTAGVSSSDSVSGISFNGASGFEITNAVVENVTIDTSGNWGFALYLGDVEGASVRDAVLSTAGTSVARALQLSLSSDVVLENVDTSVTGSSTITILASFSNNITFSDLNSTNTVASGYAFYAFGNGLDNIRVINSTLSAPSGTDVGVDTSVSTDSLYLINTSFDVTSVDFLSTGGRVHRGWYIDLYVSDNLGDPLVASINYTDSGANPSINPTSTATGLATGTDGYYRNLVLYEWSENPTSRYSHTNYSFDVASSGYSPLLDQSRNFSDNAQLTFTFGLDTCSPPGSGDWTVEISDNCSVSSAVDLHPAALRLQGSGGTFTIEATGSLTVGDLHYEPDVFDSSSTFIILTGGTLNVKP